MFVRGNWVLAVAGATGVALTANAAERGGAEESYVQAPDMVVTGTRTEARAFELPMSIDSVGGVTIQDAQQMVNLSETAVRVPGIVVNNRYNTAQELAVSTRGFGARSQFGVRGVRLYADGIPLTMPDGQGQTGTFNLDTAERVEYLRGPFSALYGNSSGGVVQIFTRDGAPEPTATLGGFFGSYDTQRAYVTVEGEAPQANLNYIVNSAHYTTGGYRDHSEGSRDTVHAKFAYTPTEATTVTLITSYFNQPDSEDPQGLTPAQYEQDPKQPNSPEAIIHDARAERSQTQVGAILDHAFSEAHSVRLLGYYGTRDNLNYQTLPPGPTKRAVEIERVFGGADGRWTYEGTFNDRPFTMVAGISYETATDDRSNYRQRFGVIISPVPTRYEIQSVRSFDEYAQVTWEPTDRWLVLAGLRHTNVRFHTEGVISSATGSVSYSNTSPVIGATFRMTPFLNLYANYGEGFETPTFIEVTYVDPATPDVGPNTGLQPSDSRNYEIGAKALLTDTTRMNLALYKVDTSNEIVVDQGQGTTASFKNAGDTERYGLELLLESALPWNFGFYGAFSLMSAEFADTFCSGAGCGAGGGTTVLAGNEIPGTYGATAYAELSWTHPASGFNSAFETIYQSDTYVFDTNDRRDAQGSAFVAEEHVLLNLRGGFRQQWAGWQFYEYFRVENLADTEYVSSVRVNNTNGFEPGPGRNWIVGLSASYAF